MLYSSVGQKGGELCGDRGIFRLFKSRIYYILISKRAFNGSHRFHLPRRKLAGEEGRGIEQFVSIAGPPNIGRTALPVDFAQRGTLEVLPFCIVNVLAEGRVPQGRLQKYLIGTERTAETGTEAWLLLYQITAESIGDAHPIAALAKIITSASAIAMIFFIFVVSSIKNFLWDFG